MRCLTLLCLLAAIAVGLASCAHKAPKPAAVKSPAPDFSLSALDGSQVSLSALRGRPVVLAFGSNACPACRLAAPDFEQLCSKYRERRVGFLAIALQDQRESLESFVKSAAVGCPVLLGTDSVAREFSVELLPTYVVLDPAGNPAFRSVGYEPDSGLAALDRAVAKLAQKGAKAQPR